MGKADMQAKAYMKDLRIFADVFNQYVYEGRQVISPENLRPNDTAKVVLPYQDGGGLTERKAGCQRYRDVDKVLLSMTDGRTEYCILAVENEAKINYAMPIRNFLYDAMEYAEQASRINAQYHSGEKKGNPDEFLSGFGREDKLLPVITLVFYFGADEWDGPLTLREMYRKCDSVLMKYVPDYRLNLITPHGLTDEEIDRFRTSLREVTRFLKYSKDKEKLKEVMNRDERFRQVERRAVDLINTVTKAGIEYSQEEERVDMCEAIKGIREEGVYEGKREGLTQGLLQAVCSLKRKQGMTDEQAFSFLDIPESEWADYKSALQ